jgi:hypothetical protein
MIGIWPCRSWCCGCCRATGSTPWCCPHASPDARRCGDKYQGRLVSLVPTLDDLAPAVPTRFEWPKRTFKFQWKTPCTGKAGIGRVYIAEVDPGHAALIHTNREARTPKRCDTHSIRLDTWPGEACSAVRKSFYSCKSRPRSKSPRPHDRQTLGDDHADNPLFSPPHLRIAFQGGT